MREEHRVGSAYLATVTTLLQRIRGAHPTAGLYEAADLQWWWRTERSTDQHPQLFWFDDLGVPEAGIIATAWRDRIGLDPMVLPDSSPDVLRHVVERGLAHAADSGFETIGLEVDRADDVLSELLLGHGFTVDEEEFVETWLAADARPRISPLPEGYRLCSRADSMSRPHHMISEQRKHPDPEPRLRQTSLYRADLDLVVFDSRDDVAAYGLFWFDPVTATGLVEPMRTDDDHQRRGLARHVLTAGIDLLARAGAERIKICYETDNPAAKRLYLGVGFEPVRQTAVYTRRSLGAGQSSKNSPSRQGKTKF